jgi:protein-S-isoprenylcysteine O-methyltransferase Ste14
VQTVGRNLISALYAAGFVHKSLICRVQQENYKAISTSLSVLKLVAVAVAVAVAVTVAVAVAAAAAAAVVVKYKCLTWDYNVLACDAVHLHNYLSNCKAPRPRKP